MSERARIIAVCLSDRKGTTKKPVGCGRLIEGLGLAGDAHAGTPVRQVSLLCRSSIEKMRAGGADVGYGDFAENLTVDGLQYVDFPIGAILNLQRGPVLEVTQIGKECHTGCAIREIVGDCVMPREGIFARVVRGGEVRAGDSFEVVNGDA